MAIYTFEKDGKEVDFEAKISEYDELKEKLEADGWRRIIKPLRFVDGATGDIYRKSSNGWNDVLKRVKRGSGRGNTINTK